MRIFCHVTPAMHYTGHIHEREDNAEPHLPANDTASPKISGVDYSLAVREVMFNDMEVLVGK